MAHDKNVRFEQDPHNDEANQRKHGLSFADAAELFAGDSDFLVIYDEAHSDEEDRFIAIGPVRAGIVLVVYTDRKTPQHATAFRAAAEPRL